MVALVRGHRTLPDPARPMSRTIRVLISLALASASLAQGSVPRRSAPLAAFGMRVHHVDAAATGASDGRSWANAFPDLQSALAIARPGEEIWVAAGVYTPSTSDASASFVVPSAVQLYGGFVGNETGRGQRDWIANPTVLSGDIGQDDVVVSWPSNWSVTTPNAGHVLVASGCSSATTIDGFVVESGGTGPAGTPAGDPLQYGSGIFMVGGSPTVRHCVFRRNVSSFGFGAGMYVLDGAPHVEACTFEENYVHSGGGGGIAAAGATVLTVKDTLFRANQVVATSISAGNGDGAGIFHWMDGSLHLERCRFENNLARSFFLVGDEIGYGGGVTTWAPATVEACEFVGNTAHLGAGFLTFHDATITNSIFVNNHAPTQPNDPYPENGGIGAGVLAYSYAVHDVHMVGCTIANNTGKKHVGIDTVATGAHVTLENSIVWGNTGTQVGVVGFSREQVAGSYDASYSCVKGLFGPPEAGEDLPDAENYPGCIEANPLLAGSLDLHLSPGSPCIDAGDSGAIPTGVTTDLDGAPRRVDDLATPDTGAGAAPIVDMGAYEVQ